MRLIDADELRGRIIAFSTGCRTTYLTVANIVMMINKADTVDAVPVVRCRDCIHRLGDEYPMCMLHTEPCANARGYKGEAVCVEMDGFCSYGKERTKPINSAPLNQEEKVDENSMSNELTYMDCWNFIAPLLPVNTDFGQELYVMIFHALKEAEKKRIAEKKKEDKHDT